MRTWRGLQRNPRTSARLCLRLTSYNAIALDCQLKSWQGIQMLRRFGSLRCRASERVGECAACGADERRKEKREEGKGRKEGRHAKNCPLFSAHHRSCRGCRRQDQAALSSRATARVGFGTPLHSGARRG